MNLTKRKQYLPFSAPMIGEEEIAEVVHSLRSGWVTTGPKVQRFEVDFAAYVGAQQALALNSCTAALHIALSALGVGPGDEVIVPTLTFCSTANVVVHLGARPVLVDVCDDFNANPRAIERAITPRTKAIIPVHFAGQPCDLAAIRTIASARALPVVEDCAHAVGAEYQDVRLGNPAVSSIACFSFYANKNMTTGEGGMLVCADADLAARARLLSLHGMSRDAWKRYTGNGSWYYDVVEAGYKDNMTDIQASLGIHQLRKLDRFLDARARLAARYIQALSDVAEVELPIVHKERRHAWHLFVIRLRLERLRMDRAAFIDELRQWNIGASVHFIPVHHHEFYRRTFGYSPPDLPVAAHLYPRLVSLPLFPMMTDSDVEYVAERVQSVLEDHRL